MTRDWVFTLTLANQWYNLWNDLISRDNSFIDRTFANAPYVPNMVCELKFQNQTPGSTIFKADSKKQGGFQLTSGSWDVDRENSNIIDLNNVNFQSDTANASLYVKITAN